MLEAALVNSILGSYFKNNLVFARVCIIIYLPTLECELKNDNLIIFTEYY